MKGLLTSIIIFSFFSCVSNDNSNESNEEDCVDQFSLIIASPNTPLLNFEVDWSKDSIQSVTQSLFNENLCEKCENAQVAIELFREGQNIKIPVQIEYSFECCQGCPIPIIDRDYYQILINGRDQLLVEGELTSTNSLDTIISNHWKKNADENLHFYLDWQPETSREVLDHALNSICTAYISEIERRNNKSTCEMKDQELNSIRESCPLTIQLATCKSAITDITSVSQINLQE